MKTIRTSSAVVAAALVVCLHGASPGDTITLQPDGDAGKDVSVTVGFGLHYVINYSAATVFGVDPLYFGVALVEFDLAGIDPSITVTSAELGLYAYEANASGDYWLYGVTEPWTEPAFSPTGEVTGYWEALPATEADAKGSLTVAAGNPGWLAWDVTSLASSWIDGSSANHGVMISSDSGAIELWASEHTEPELRPYLRIDYVSIPEPTTLVLLATGLVMGVAGWRRRRVTTRPTGLPDLSALHHARPQAAEAPH
jgi:hypothetical protein